MVENVSRHVIVRGRVQGVGYRAFVAHEADRRALEGWVRNRRDGTVEAVFAGPDDAVRAMIGTCRKGPPGSHVEAIEERAAGTDELALRGRERFAVLATA